MFLIKFIYVDWCQSPERLEETLLVHALTYEEACLKIKSKYDDVIDFKNCTI